MSAPVPSSSMLTEARLREPLRLTLATRAVRRLPLGSTTAAAVLVPIFERDGEVHMWLVRRPTSMRSHAGQVAFPGGKNDVSDESLLDTALREAEEELGIERARVDVLGALGDVPTGTGFRITPWVGWIAQGETVRPNPSEVARAFAPPLRVFVQPGAQAGARRSWTFDGELVWGATALIIADLLDTLARL